MIIDNWLIYIFSFLGGVLPALFWVWFWNKEDRLHPEPKKVLFLVFLSGMVSVFFTIIFQSYVDELDLTKPKKMFLFVMIEEFLKFFFAYITILWNKKIVDEPIDTVIYMFTVAFGFAAAENILFLLKEMTNSGILSGLSTGNLRFVGATLLHALSSAIIGIFMAFSYYKSNITKIIYTTLGFILAVFAHYIFNMLLISKFTDNIWKVFIIVWVGLVFVMFILEKIKKIHK